MRIKFCPKCGRELKNIYENLCKECFLEKFIARLKLPSRIVIKRCKNCGIFFFNKKEYETLEKTIEDFLIKLFKDENIKIINYKIIADKVYVRIKLKVKGLEKTEEKKFKLKTKVVTCKYCSLKLNKYFTTILQIRGSINKKILDEIEKQINAIHRYDKLAFISGVEEMPVGFNIFIGSKSAARSVVNKLKRKYKIKTKVSRKLYGIRKGKKVYRDTILMEFDKI